GWRLYWQGRRFLALEGAIGVAGRPPVQRDLIGPIGNKPTSGDEGPFEVDRGQLGPGCKCDDPSAMEGRPAACCNEQAAIRRARERRNRALDFGCVASGASAANSAGCLRISAALLVAQRVSIRTFRPILQPNSASS